MKIERKSLPKSRLELIVEESAENIAKFRKKAVKYISDNVSIPGFRKGVAIPEKVIAKNYGEDHISKVTIDFAIDSMYKQALKKEKIIPVAQAEIKEIISESPLKIKIHIEVFPEIEIDKKYKNIKLKKKVNKVTAAEVKNAMDEIQTKFTKFEESTDKKSKVASGDRVTIDTDGYEKDKLLETTSMRDYPLVIGSGMLVPGFEEGIIGAKTGDELELDITFPKDYHNEEFKGKKTKFKVTIKKLEKAVKPEFTPKFIKDLRGKDLDLDGFKALIKTEIQDVKDSNSRLEEESKLIEELLKVTKLEIGDSMLKNQIDKVYNEIKENMAKDGIKPENYLESLKMDEAQYKETNVKPIALKRLNGELILHKLNEIEKIEVSEKDMEKEIESIMKGFESEDVLKRLKELYVPGNKYYEELKQRVAYRNLIDSFFE